jgi:LCP family protein required for cell wall assembly
MFKKQKANNEIKNETPTAPKQIDWLKWGLIGLFAIAAIVISVLAFLNTREIVRTTDIFQLPGLSIQETNESSESSDDTTSADDTANSSPAINTESNEVDFSSRINVLLMGLDYRDWSTSQEHSRTDTMILVTLDPISKTAGILSIPRDLWVNVPGFGQYKINTAYYLGQANRLPGGGPELAARTVEEFLGIEVHYWAQVDFTAFVQFIDYIGGIKMEFTEPITVEMIGGKKETLQVGRAVLDGSLALAYARNRSAGDGDFDRARRQQQVIMAIREQLLRADVQRLLLSNPRGVWDIFSEGIQTNVPFESALQLGLLALRINPQQITQKVIAPPNYVTHAKSPDGLEILKPITQNIRTLRDEVFPPVGLVGPAASGKDLTELVQEEAASIGIYNGSSVSGLAQTTETYLRGISLNVAEVGNSDWVPSTTIYDYTGNPYTLQYLITLMNIQSTRIYSSFDPTSSIDVGIVLGDDWQVP